MAVLFDQDKPEGAVGETVGTPNSLHLRWTPVIAGAIVAAALSSVLLTFGSAVGLSVASPSSTWRDTSALLSLLGGLWLLLTSLASFALGGYLAGMLRPTVRTATPHEIEFRDGVHGLLVWGIAVLIGAALAFATSRTIAQRYEGTVPSASNAEPFLAFELDRLFRPDPARLSDQAVAPASDRDAALRAQAARIIVSGLGHNGIAAEDRAYLVQAVAARAGVTQPQAEAHVDRAFTDSSTAITRARRSAVILAFMIGASLIVGAAIAWLAAAAGGKHRDESISHPFWHRWEVDRLFFIR